MFQVVTIDLHPPPQSEEVEKVSTMSQPPGIVHPTTIIYTIIDTRTTFENSITYSTTGISVNTSSSYSNNKDAGRDTSNDSEPTLGCGDVEILIGVFSLGLR
jgi:hypothetical protein